MKISIVLANCWLLPPPCSIENNDRLTRIISFIKLQSPDVFALQEVWLQRYVNRIRKEFPEYFIYSSSGSWHNTSGLVTGTKKKPLSFSQTFFLHHRYGSLLEKAAHKGYHLLMLDKDLIFINTHLYTATSSKTHNITAEQCAQLEAVVRGRKAIIAGDLNLEEDVILHHSKSFFFSDNVISTSSPSNKYRNERLNVKTYTHDLLDHIITTRKDMMITSRTVVEEEFSDHYPVVGEVTIPTTNDG